MRSFKGTIIIYLEYSQSSILSTVLCIFLTLKFATIQFYRRTFFQCTFQNTSHRETNFFLKQLYFQSNIDYVEMKAVTWSSYFFAERIFSEYLAVWNSYFFLITTLS